MSIDLESLMKKNVILGKHAEQYQRLQKQLSNLPLLAVGNVFATEPHPNAPRASTHYKWTRKIKGKTVSATLSKEQFDAFNEAIEANKTLEETLRQMRALSHDAILLSLPDSPGKQRRNSS